MMLAGIIFRVDRALGKERLRNERDAARWDRDEFHRRLDIALGERNEYLRQLDIALGERNESLRQLDEIERERTRHRSHDLVSALANAFARMTAQRDELKAQLERLNGRTVEPDDPTPGLPE